MVSTKENAVLDPEDLELRSWKQLLRDPRVWAIIALTVTMSASVTSQVEKYTGLKFNPSEDSMSHQCVLRALYGGELSDAERLTGAKVCVPTEK